MIEINVETRQATVTDKETLTSGSAGIQVHYILNEEWDGLTRVAVFRNDDDSENTQIDVALTDELTCTIPAENLTHPDKIDTVVYAGIYGTDGQGTVIIPTVWVSLGPVKEGAVRGNASGADPTPDMWAQLQYIAEHAGEENALDAEAWAVGERGGTEVSDTDPTYHNNAKYYSGVAGDHATDAGNAQTAAETAQGLAETAQGLAEVAQGKAEDAQEAAEVAQGLAETAQGKAEDAQEAAETAQGLAETAQGKAEDAQGYAETAQGAAEAAATLAESWAVGGTSSRTGEDTNNAEYWAEQAAASAAVFVIDDTLTQSGEAADAKAAGDAIATKVDKVNGKGLSTEDYTTEEKTKLSGIAAGAEVNVQSDWNQSDNTADDYIKNKPENLVQDASYVHTDNNYTDDEKTKLAGLENGAYEYVRLLLGGGFVDYSEEYNGFRYTVKNNRITVEHLTSGADTSKVYSALGKEYVINQEAAAYSTYIPVTDEQLLAAYDAGAIVPISGSNNIHRFNVSYKGAQKIAYRFFTVNPSTREVTSWVSTTSGTAKATLSPATMSYLDTAFANGNIGLVFNWCVSNVGDKIEFIFDCVPQSAHDYEIKQSIASLNAGNIAYDDSETYTDGTVGKKVSQLNSEINTKADVIVDSVSSAPIASFPDGANNMPIRELNVSIEPIQDLHGYANPWPAGGGDNKLPYDLSWIKANNTSGTWNGNQYIYNGITFTFNDDGTISTNGTATANITLDIGAIALSGGTSYILNGCPSGGSTLTYLLSFPGVGYDSGSGYTYTPSGDVTVNVRVTVYNGTNMTGKVFKPMVRLASVTDATFKPWENICPISGWTGAQGVQTEKNFAELTFGNQVPSVLSGQMVSVNGWSSDFIKVDNSCQYVVSRGTSDSGYVLFYDQNKTYLSYYMFESSVYSYLLSTYSRWGATAFVKLRSDALSGTNPLIQLEPGSVASPYEAFTSTPIAISWEDEAGTVYGGTLTVHEDGSCDLLSTRATDLINGSQNLGSNGIQPYGGMQIYFSPSKNKKLAPSYQTQNEGILSDKFSFTQYDSSSPWSVTGRSTNGNIYVNLSAEITTAELARTWFTNNPSQFSYLLATPVSYTLESMDQLYTKLGTNNIWFDTGDTRVTYPCDLKAYIDKRVAALT